MREETETCPINRSVRVVLGKECSESKRRGERVQSAK
jgi:hypothetical protein